MSCTVQCFTASLLNLGQNTALYIILTQKQPVCPWTEITEVFLQFGSVPPASSLQLNLHSHTAASCFPLHVEHRVASRQKQTTAASFHRQQIFSGACGGKLSAALRRSSWCLMQPDVLGVVSRDQNWTRRSPTCGHQLSAAGTEQSWRTRHQRKWPHTVFEFQKKTPRLAKQEVDLHSKQKHSQL